MAPLLGRKPFPLVKPLPGEEPLFTIAHTQEAFRTREYPFQPGPPGRRRGGAGWAGGSPGPEGRDARASGSCQRARRRRACSPRRELEPAVPRGGRAGERAGPEPRALHPFPAPHFVPGASLSRSGPLSPPGGIRPPSANGRGFPWLPLLFKLSLSLEVFAIVPMRPRDPACARFFVCVLSRSPRGHLGFSPPERTSGWW